MIDGADAQWTNEDRAGLAFVRMRETEQQRLDDVMTARLARTSADGDDKQAELVPVEFQGLEPVLSKNPEVAVSKGLVWFAQDRAEFPFRGGNLLNRAFPTSAPDLAAALGRLVQSGGDTEIDFSLALLQNYRGSASAHGVLKEIVSRFPQNDRKMDGVRISINSPGTVSGEFGLAEARQPAACTGSDRAAR